MLKIARFGRLFAVRGLSVAHPPVSIVGARPRLAVPSIAAPARLQSSIKMDKPMLMLAFTCKKCNERSSHILSKQAYNSGTVLVQCPGCKNRHLIADHLKIFSDDHITVEDLLASKGESVTMTTDDLAFEDIPEKLRGLIGHHAKDAPKKPSDTKPTDEQTPLLKD